MVDARTPTVGAATLYEVGGRSEAYSVIDGSDPQSRFCKDDIEGTHYGVATNTTASLESCRPDGGSHGRKAIHSRLLSQLWGHKAEAMHTAYQKTHAREPNHGALTRAVSIHGHEAGGMGPLSCRMLFWPALAQISPPLAKAAAGRDGPLHAATWPLGEATKSGGCFRFPSAPAARPLGNFCDCC